MFKSWIVFACVAVVSTASPQVVSAQSTAEPQPASVRRPYRGIFGGSADPAAPQSLVFSASVYRAYDDNILAALSNRRVHNSWMQRSGSYWGSSAGLTYTLAKTTERFSIGGSSAGLLQYRPGFEDHVTPSFNGDLHMTAKLTRTTTLSAGEAVSYRPNYSDGLTPVAGGDIGFDSLTASDPDFDLFQLRTVRTASFVTLEQRFGRKLALSGGYQFRTLDVEQEEGLEEQASRFHDYRSHAASVALNYTNRLSPHAELVLGYGVRVKENDRITSEPRLMHNVNAGVNYSRALSFSRRTSLNFGTGSTIITREQLQVPDAEPRTRIHLLGNANLVHEMGRTWTAQLSYARGLASRDGFSELYSTSALSAVVEGLVTRRLSFSSNASLSRSTLDRAGANAHDRTSATAQATYALTSYLAVYTRYIYYQYDYGEDIPLDPRFAGGLERQGVRLGLTTSWVIR